MIGNGHIVMDGIVEGVACDLITFDRSNSIHLIKPPLYSNRIIVNSNNNNFCYVVLPDIKSMFSTIGRDFFLDKPTNPSLFTFKMDIVNVGNNYNIGVFGRARIQVSADYYPFNRNEYPLLYYWGSQLTPNYDWAFSVAPKRRLSVLLI